MARFAKRLPESLDSAPSATAQLQSRSSTLEPHPEAVAFRWVERPPRGRPFEMDLTALASGNSASGVTPRPALAAALLPEIKLMCRGKSESTGKNYGRHLRLFWAYLDRQEEAGLPAKSLADIDDADGVMFRSYMLHDLKLDAVSASAIYTMRTAINMARRRARPDASDLIWPNVKTGRGTRNKDVDPRILRPVYDILKSRYYAFLNAQERGRAMVQDGVDPRQIGDGRDKAAWSIEANMAVATRDYIEQACRVASIKATDIHDYFADPRNYGLPIFAPASGGITTAGAFDRVRWFAPQIMDAACCFFLVQLQFGWNVEAVRHIDISEAEGWFDQRLGERSKIDSDATVAIYGFKNKSNKEQIGFSRTKPRHHPYRVIRTMIVATESLRQAAKEHLAQLKELPQTHAIERQIAQVEQSLGSPWLYFNRSTKNGTRIGALSGHTLIYLFRSICRAAYKEVLRRLVRSRSVRRLDGTLDRGVLRELRRPYLSLRELTPSDLRDGFASWVYDTTLSNIAVVQKALGHASSRTTRHYLRQRRQIAQRFGAFTRFEEALWDEVAQLRRIDPTVLFIRSTTGAITDEQRQRLTDHRNRTRMGMGCVDPERPPTEMVPQHKGGPCAVQRCVLCAHGLLFQDSLPALAVRKAELRRIRSFMAHDRWRESSFEFEWSAIEATIARFFSDRRGEFEAAADLHGQALAEGRAYLFDQVAPSYFETIAHA